MSQKDKKVEITAKGLENLLNKTMEKLEEERDLSLEKYRRIDSVTISADDFLILGDKAIPYLKQASMASNACIEIAKLISNVLIKDSAPNKGGNGGAITGAGSSNLGSGDAQKSEILKLIKQVQKEGEDL